MITPLTPTEQRPAFFRTTSSTSQVSHKSSKSLSVVRTFSHQKNKLRLYLALFPRGGTGSTYSSQATCDSYHWALVLGPKSPLRSEAGTAYHIVHGSSTANDGPYYYEEADLSQQIHQSRAILIRVAVAKVLDEERVQALLRSTALPSIALAGAAQGKRKDSLAEHTYSCLDWTRDTYKLLTSDSQKSLKSYFGPEDWVVLEERARKYVKKKRQQGRFQASAIEVNSRWSADEIPTFNFWENRETTD